MLCTALVLAAAAVALCWLFLSWNFDYWRKRRVKYENPFSPFEDRGPGLPIGQPFWTLLDPLYKKYHGRERIAGTFVARQPVLVLLDPELAKTVLTKDFSSFRGRGQAFDEKNDPISANLFNLEGQRWKNLRAKLSPTFTSGKLRHMVPLIVDVGKELEGRVRRLAEAAAGRQVEMRDALLRYTTDVIGSVAFGIQCNSLKDEEGEIYTLTRAMFRGNILFVVRLLLVSVHPVFARILPFRTFLQKASEFFLRLMKETVEYREEHDITRNDFVQIMMQLRADDRLQTDRVNHIEFTHGVMTAQAFIFFVAGLDSIANTSGFALHELALHPELQQRAAEEVRAMRAKYNGVLSYEAARDMELLDRIVRETLRKYCPVGALIRVPDTTYQIPDTDVVIDRRVQVQIPVWQMQHDPEYYPEPERFDPDRFTEENKSTRHPFTFLVFGEGPRICIAERFAVLEMKLVLAGLLEKFVFSVCEKTDLKMELDPKQFNPTAAKGVWLSVADRPS